MSQTENSASDLDARILSLGNTLINDKPPYHAGVCAIPNFTIFYGPVDDTKRLDLSKASEAELDHLTRTCQAATFGVDQKDVPDETYRKAGKLDSSAKFDIVESGILDTIKNEFLEGNDDNRAIRAELYKLNVYDNGCFFKTHKDTPRADSMFGSVVVVFPTPHVGGALVLRKDGRSWTFDSANEVAKSPNGHPVVGYIAFYSDVDHEVTEVTLGHRVTLTYNLYFHKPADKYPQALFRSCLEGLLSDKTLNIKLGFGLMHQYPIRKDIQLLLSYLKGSDALIGRICAQLELNCYLRLIYSDRYDETKVMVDHVVDLSDYDHDIDSTHLLVYKCNGVRVNANTTDYYGRKQDKIEWVTPLTEMTTVESRRITYGNEASLETIYGNLCLIVEIGEH